MSDVTIGTIIGGAIALLAGIVGAIIQGIFSTRNLRLQFNYQKEQAQLERLINLRAQYLNPLREQITKCYETLNVIEGCLIRIGVFCNHPENMKMITETKDWDSSKEISEYITKLDSKMDQLKNEFEQAIVICVKAGEHKINILAKETNVKIVELSQEVNLIKGIPFGYKSKNGKSANIDETIAKLIDLFSRMEDIFGHIENILCGIH